MLLIRCVAVSATIIVAIATDSVSLDAQAALQANQPSPIAVSIAMAANRVPVGQEVRAIMTMTNIGGGIAVETGDPSNYRLHVQGPGGEPPKTLWHRRLLGEPGLEPLEMTLPAFPRDIFPGRDVERTFLLTFFYDLRVPGKYTIYMEVRDGSGAWLRTNTATFEIHTPPQ
jgi:hypothetical protein